MKSRHGTFLNGSRIRENVPLKDNNSIDIGGITLLFTLNDFPDKESALAHYRKTGERVRRTELD